MVVRGCVLALLCGLLLPSPAFARGAIVQRFTYAWTLKNVVTGMREPFQVNILGTVQQFGCTCIGATTCTGVVIEAEECDSSGNSCVVIATSGAVTMNANGARVNASTASITNALFETSDQLQIRVSTAGTPSEQIQCDLQGVER